MTIRRSIVNACVLLLLWQLTGAQSHAADPVPDEFRVKSALVFNIVKFVDWPEKSFAQSASPMVICTLGPGEFTSAVADLQGKQLKGRTVMVRQISKPDDGRSCHVLVIGDADQNLMQSVLNRLRNQAVLSISDRDRFTHSNGVVGFYHQGNKVRFEINLMAAQQHQLKISSQLLKLARIVRQDEP